MPGRFLIYGLFDPRNGHLRYIGKSARGLRRIREHFVPSALRETNHKSHWLTSLQSQGVTATFDILEEHTDAHSLIEAEIFWIGYAKMLGCRLTNLSNGGEGCGFGFRRSAETKAKMSAGMMGNRRCVGTTWSPARRAKFVATYTGHPVSPSTRLRIALARGGKPFEDDLGVRYETVAQAGRVLGLQSALIRKVLKGTRAHTGGRSFRYIEGASIAPP